MPSGPRVVTAKERQPTELGVGGGEIRVEARGATERFLESLDRAEVCETATHADERRGTCARIVRHALERRDRLASRAGACEDLGLPERELLVRRREHERGSRVRDRALEVANRGCAFGGRDVPPETRLVLERERERVEGLAVSTEPTPNLEPNVERSGSTRPGRKLQSERAESVHREWTVAREKREAGGGDPDAHGARRGRERGIGLGPRVAQSAGAYVFEREGEPLERSHRVRTRSLRRRSDRCRRGTPGRGTRDPVGRRDRRCA